MAQWDEERHCPACDQEIVPGAPVCFRAGRVLHLVCALVPCPRCGRRLTPTDSALFGVVHVECLTREARGLLEDRVLDFLRERPEPWCQICLAGELRATYASVAHTVKRLRVTDTLRLEAGVCSACETRRVTVTTA
jgi:hypothetical protein